MTATRVALLAALLLFARAAHAYRPFDGTDADVAELHEIELEVGPIGYLHDPTSQYVVVPNFVFNYGFVDNWELVLQTRGVITAEGDDSSRFALDDSAILVKHVFREGTLQDKSGASVAMELGLLFPSTNGVREQLGGSLDVITSYRFSHATAHLNLQVSITPAQEIDLFGGVILEGPNEWRVRPVSELYVETQTGGYRAYSALIGAIWRVQEHLDLDFGARVAAIGGADTSSANGIANGNATGVEVELRAGFSWGIATGARHQSAQAVR